MFRIIRDDTYREHFSYRNSAFPFMLCVDDFENMHGHALDCHWHDAVEITAVISGEVLYMLNGAPVLLGEGESIYVNGGSLHAARPAQAGKNAVTVGFLFERSLVEGGFDFQRPGKYLPECGGMKLGRDSGLTAVMEQLAALDQAGPGYELACMSAIYAACHIVLSYGSSHGLDTVRNGGPSAEMKRMLTYISEHFNERLSVDALAEYGRLSRSSCFRCFRSHTGMNPMEFINDYRLKWAVHLLDTSPMSVTEIAGACGFASSSHLGKVFRDRYGCTPMKYRRRR